MCKKLIILLLLVSVNAYAHKISIFAERTGDNISLEAFFQDGNPCSRCEVMGSDREGNELKLGTTDDYGYFRFLLRGAPVQKVSVDGGMGHRGETVILPAESKTNVEDGGMDSGHSKKELEGNKKVQPDWIKILAGALLVFGVVVLLGRLKRK